MQDSGKRIAVLGAGIMGLCAARALREHAVFLFDPDGFPARNSSSFMAGGMLSPWSEIEHLPEEFLPAAQHGLESWKNFRSFRRSGSLIVAHEGDEYILDRLAQKLPGRKLIGTGEIAALEPDARFSRGIFIENEAHINPQDIIAELTESIGNRIPARAEPAQISPEYDWVIDCRGFAAERDDKNLRGVKGEAIIVRNPGFTLSRPLRLMHPRYPLYIVPRPDHVFMIGATVIESEDKTVALRSAMELLTAAYSLHPSFAESEILEIRAGLRPAYADNLPRIARDGNIIRCNGLFRHGFLLAPVMAECVADMIAGRGNNFISLFERSTDADHHQRTTQKHQRRA